VAEQEYDFSDVFPSDKYIKKSEQEFIEEEQNKFVPPETQVEKEDSDNEYDFSGIDFDKVREYNISEDTSTKRQYEYGVRQQRTVTGYALNYLDAAYDSMFDSKVTLEDALAQNEAERNAEIWLDYAEFKNLPPEQETLAMLGGRLTVDLVDPVTFLLPAYKYAKAGSAAKSIAYGTAFGGADGYLRGQAEGSKSGVTDTVVGAGFGAGAAGVAVLGVKAFNGLKNKISSKGLETIKETAENADASINAPKKVYPEADSPENIPEELSPIEEKNLEASIKKNVTTETIEEIVDASPAVKTGITPVIEIQKVYNSLKRKSERLTAIGTKKSRAEKVQVDSQLKEVESRLLNAQKKFVNDQLDLRLAQVDKNIDVMEDMSLEGTLTDKIIHQLFYSTTRPIVGGFGGYASSAFFTDGTGTNDDAITLGFVLAGAGLGNWSKVLREGEKSKYAISTFDRENLKMVVDAEQNLLTKRFINMAVSGSLSSRLETTGGWAKITGNLLFDTIGNATDSVESKVNRGNRAFMNQLATTLGDYSVDTFLSQKGNQSLRKVVGEVVNNFVDVNDLKVGYRGITNDYKPLTQIQIDEIKRIAPLVKAQQTELADSVQAVGIPFKRLDNDEYGLTQLYDMENISNDLEGFEKTIRKALQLEFPDDPPETIIDKTNEFIANLRGQSFRDSDLPSTADNIFKDGKFRPLTNHFEKHRLINNPQARHLLAKEGFFDLDVMNTMNTYAERTIKAREFAEVFGPNGEFLEYVFRDIDEAFTNVTYKGSEFKKVYKNDLIDSINTFWGVGGLDPIATKKLVNIPIAALTTLANTTYLSRVTLSSLGDLIQPIQNSGFYAGIKGLAGKFKNQGSFSERAGFKYDGSWEKDFSAMMAHGDDPLDTFRTNLNKFNKGFFELIQLPRLTRTARAFAYDTGVYRAFDLSKKKKLGRAKLKELQSLGLSKEQLDTLKEFKTAEQAFNSDEGRFILDVAGQRAADRDALIPGMGNRAMFTQSRNPLVRQFGQFYSWAQAKTAQTNSLVKRIENGDGALAVRMLGLISVYNGVQHLKEITNPNYDPIRERNNHFFDNDQGIKEAMLLSGNFTPFQIDPILSAFSYPGSGWNSASASMGYTADLFKAVYGAFPALLENDIEKFGGAITPVVPLAGDVQGLYARIDPNFVPLRDRNAVGGAIKAHKVPNAKAESEETIDKMTGLPYDVQAGTAHVDVEDRSPNLLGTLRKRQEKSGGGVLKTAGRMFAKTDLGQEIGETVGEAVDTLKDFVNKNNWTNQTNTRNEPVEGVYRSDKDTEEVLNLTEESVKEWEQVNKGKGSKQQQPKEMIQAVKDLKEKKITEEEYDTLVGEILPIVPIKEVPKFSSLSDIALAVDKNQRQKGIINSNVFIEDGAKVSSRLDIPAYEKYDQWVMSIHEPKKSGDPLAYGQGGILNNVTFETSPITAMGIAEKIKSKGTIARMYGEWENAPIEDLRIQVFDILKEMNTPSSRRQTKTETAFIKDLYSSRADWQEFLEEMNYEVSIDENYNLLMKPTLDNVNALDKYFSSSRFFEDGPLPPRMRFGRLSESGRFSDQWMPEWTQVGVNPYRHSFFYDKSDKSGRTPLISATKALQVGPLVLAKGAKFGGRKDKEFFIPRYGIAFHTQGEKNSTLEQILSDKNVKNYNELQEQADVLQTTVGKSITDLMQTIENKSNDKSYKIIARKVSDKVEELKTEGFNFNVKVLSRDPDNPNRLVPTAGGLVPDRIIKRIPTASGMVTTRFQEKTVNLYLNNTEDIAFHTNGMNYTTALHEGVHAALAGITELASGAPVNSKLAENYKRLNDLQQTVVKAFNRKAYADMTPFERKIKEAKINPLDNIDEIVAWGLTDVHMQEMLESLPYKGDRTMWDSFVETIRTILKLSPKEDTALSELLSLSSRLFKTDMSEVAPLLAERTRKLQEQAAKTKASEGGLLNTLKRKSA